MNSIIDTTLANRMRSGTGLPVTTQAIELVFPAALAGFQAAADEGKPVSLEDNFLIPALKALWAEFHKSGGKNFDDFVQQRFANSGDTLLQKFFARRETVQADLDELKTFYETGMALRDALQASTSKQQTLTDQIAEATADLAHIPTPRLSVRSQPPPQPITCGIRGPRDQSIFANSIDYVIHAPVYRTLLTKRIALLKGQLAAEEAKAKALDAQLKDTRRRVNHSQSDRHSVGGCRRTGHH